MEEYAGELVAGATGVLGWAPDMALDTPMPLIAAALAARTRAMSAHADMIAAAVLIPLFGGKKQDDALPSPPVDDRGRLDRPAVARGMAAMLRGLAKRRGRKGRA